MSDNFNEPDTSWDKWGEVYGSDNIEDGRPASEVYGDIAESWRLEDEGDDAGEG